MDLDRLPRLEADVVWTSELTGWSSTITEQQDNTSEKRGESARTVTGWRAGPRSAVVPETRACPSRCRRRRADAKQPESSVRCWVSRLEAGITFDTLPPPHRRGSTG